MHPTISHLSVLLRPKKKERLRNLRTCLSIFLLQKCDLDLLCRIDYLKHVMIQRSLVRIKPTVTVPKFFFFQKVISKNLQHQNEPIAHYTNQDSTL